MKGIHTNDGILTIFLNTNYEKLLGPDNKHWLPCQVCEELKLVEMKVVSYTCEECLEKDIESYPFFP